VRVLQYNKRGGHPVKVVKVGIERHGFFGVVAGT
jgi:hypothetical protein